MFLVQFADTSANDSMFNIVTIAALVIAGVLLIVTVILLIIFIRQRTVVKRAYVSASVLSDL